MDPIFEDTPVDRDEQAALWYLALAEGSLSDGDQEALDRWMADPANAAALQRQSDLWCLTEAAADEPEAIRLRTDALERFRELNEARWALPKRGPGRRWAIMAIAAALILAVALGLTLRDRPEIYETDLGERQVAILGDGTRLTLDADSQVEVAMLSERRKVTVVRGRAKFDVAKDSLRPFMVEAGDHTVVATGTAFSIEKIGSTVSVVLYEGKVEVFQGGGDAEGQVRSLDGLTPGHSLKLASAGQGEVKPVDAERSLTWTMGQLNFDDEPLATAVARVNRYSRRPVVIADRNAATARVTGVFNAGDTQAFVEGVAAVHGLVVRRQEDRVLLASQ